MSKGSKTKFGGAALYFALAFGWSWLCWVTVAVLGLGVDNPVGGSICILGLLGPAIGGITGTYISGDKAARRDYWRRVFDTKRIGGKWALVIFAFVPVLFAVTIGLDVALGGSGTHWEGAALAIAASPIAIIPFALKTFLVGPMEEFGWHGYALDCLQQKWNALTAGLVLGVAWSAWHLPLFFIKGMYQYDLGLFTPSFWLFVLGIVPLSVAFTWVHNNTGRSILAAMLLHFMVNFTGELIALSPRAEFISIAMWTLVAIALPLLYGAKYLRAKKAAPVLQPATAG